MQVGHKIGVETLFVIVGIVEILFRDISTVEICIEAGILEAERICQREVGRKCDRRIAEIKRYRICPLVLIDIFDKILYAVA